MARLACITVPAFPLQVAVLEQPQLVGQTVVVLGPGDRPEVVACSRAAYQAGIRSGMSPSQARSRAPDLCAVAGSPVRWREEAARLADEIAAVAGLAGGIDVSEAMRGHRTAHHPLLFVPVPTGQRSERFGRRLVEVAAGHGYRARVGIAADRFTARAAALTQKGPVVVVPRGAAADFLAPLSIDLLPLADEVRSLLRAAGVRTLGQFASLPPPSAACRAAGTIDYQGLARGNGGEPASPGLPAPRRTLPSSPRRTEGRQLRLAG